MASIPPPLAVGEPVPEAAPATEEASGPRWPAWTAPAALVAGFAGAIFGAVVLGAIAGAAGSSFQNPPPGVQIGATLIQDVALVVSALLFARLTALPRSWHFGLRPVRFWTATGAVLAAWGTFLALSAAWIALLDIKQREDLPDELGADKSTVALVAVALLVTVVAPVAEEFFFRGFFFRALSSWRGPWVAAVITGAVFGGIHAGSAPAGFLVPLAVFGFVLCLLYRRTGSLYPCIALHALNNSLALGVSQGWDWQIPLLMIGANALIAAGFAPLRRDRPLLPA